MEFLIKSTIILESMMVSHLDKGLNIAVVYHFPRHHYGENWLFIMGKLKISPVLIEMNADETKFMFVCRH